MARLDSAGRCQRRQWQTECRVMEREEEESRLLLRARLYDFRGVRGRRGGQEKEDLTKQNQSYEHVRTCVNMRGKGI